MRLGDVTVAPKIADIDKSDEDRTAKINVSIKNNYSGTISEILLLGKIPFAGNETQFEHINLNSTYTTQMTSAGLTIPTELNRTNNSILFYK